VRTSSRAERTSRPLAPALTASQFFSGPAPALRGDGLVLRPWRASDAPALIRALADPGIRHWHMLSLAESQLPAWIRERQRRWLDRAGVDWAIAAAQDDDLLLGRIAIHRLVLGQGLGEVAYWVVPESRGRRIAPRARAALCEWAFDRGVHRLELAHSVDNPASCRVAQRAGFALEGVKRSELRHADGWHDMHLHARLAGDPPPPASS
jgi:RimJ/RimL family protein N-acetyltransferase